MLLNNIKASLERLYDIDTGVNIQDYLFEDGETPAWMKNMLFDKLPHRFESQPEEIYAKANRFAKKYGSVIEHNFILRQDNAGLLKDVRRLYRYNERNKLNHIARSWFIH